MPIDPNPFTNPIIADAQLRPSISPNSVGNEPPQNYKINLKSQNTIVTCIIYLHNIISGPQFKKPIKIMITELTKMPALAVAIKIIKPIADRNVPTVDPSNDLSLKYRLRTKPIDADPRIPPLIKNLLIYIG